MPPSFVCPWFMAFTASAKTSGGGALRTYLMELRRFVAAPLAPCAGRERHRSFSASRHGSDVDQPCVKRPTMVTVHEFFVAIHCRSWGVCANPRFAYHVRGGANRRSHAGRGELVR